MSKHAGRPFPAAALAALAVLAAAAAPNAGAGDTDRERVESRDLTRRQADSVVDPNDPSSGLLRRDHGDRLDAPLQVEAAVAWTPGGPDAGGGSGDPWEPAAEGPRYDLEELPYGPGTPNPELNDISGDGRWIAGRESIEGTCSSYGASLWERTEAAGWVLHSLPGVNGSNAEQGTALAVLDGGLAVGTDWLLAQPDCLVGASSRAVVWEPIGPGTWRATQLPAPGGGFSAATGVADIAGVGPVIVGESEAGGALWQQVAGAWTHVALGSLATDWSTRPFDIDSAGVVIGQARTPNNSDGVPFILVPLDTDGDGAPDTWHRDANGDGGNDLIHVPTDPPAPGGVQAIAAGGNAVGQLEAANSGVVWIPTGADSWLEVVLPSRDFPEGARAVHLNGQWQATGWGRQTDNRGDADNQALLWERPEGEWIASNLNDITEKGRFDVIRAGRAISEDGVIVARGSTQHESRVAFVLTPR